MARRNCSEETHHLKIDIDFDRILTIVFPHTAWASWYMDDLKSRTYHRDSRARLDSPYTVSMKLPKNVDRMHIGLSTSAEEGGAVSLVFNSGRCAAEWLANSPLWSRSRSSSLIGDMSAVIRTRWTHGDFEVRTALGLPRVQEPKQVPLATNDVLAPAVDGYPPREKKAFWKGR
jgi:hypothetical protein